MKINAIIENKDGGTLVLDFPRSIYDVYEKLQSVGIRKSPHQIALCDEECDDVRVKLYSEDEVGKHLLLTLNEQNSLADANMLVFMVDNAKADFRSKLEQNLLHDQYSSMQEVTDDIKQMLYESGPVKAIAADNVEAFDEEKAKALMGEKAKLQIQLDRIADTKQKRENAKSRLDEIFTIIEALANHPISYDDQIVRQVLESVIVESKEKIKVVFVGGLEVTQLM